jgi:hypothetical protein
MAQNWQLQLFNLSDYFNASGFMPFSPASGYRYRDQAVEILNKHLKPFGITVEAVDGAEQHNNCLIEFTEMDLNSISCEDMTNATAWESVLDNYDRQRLLEGRITKKDIEDNEALAEKIVAAMNAADKEFDEVAIDDMARVINCLDADLPLLVGHIEEETAQKILEWRLKGVS